jgi:hypothetical protein
VERRLALANQLADGALRGDARLTRRADAKVFGDALAIGARELLVDERSDERIDRSAVRH